MDDVFICNNAITVTMDVGTAVAGSVTFITGAANTTLTFGAAGVLNVTNAGARTGNVIVNAPTSNGITKQITVGASPRSLTTTGSMTLNGGNVGGTAATRTTALTVTSGTVTVGTNLVIATGTAATYLAHVQLSPVAGVGRITVNGSATLTGGAATTGVARMRVVGAANAGQGINITGNLNVNSTIATSSVVDMTGAAGGRITVGGNVSMAIRSQSRRESSTPPALARRSARPTPAPSPHRTLPARR